jgi:hypothetical protein
MMNKRNKFFGQCLLQEHNLYLHHKVFASITSSEDVNLAFLYRNVGSVVYFSRAVNRISVNPEDAATRNIWIDSAARDQLGH